MPGKVKAGAKNHDVVGGLDLMATFAAVGGVKLPENDRENKPTLVFNRENRRTCHGPLPSRGARH
jgi:hypothetical protein